MEYASIQYLYPGQWVLNWICKDGEGKSDTIFIKLKGLSLARKTMRPFNAIPVERILENFGVSVEMCRFDIWTTKGIIEVDSKLGTIYDLNIEEGHWKVDGERFPVKDAMIVMKR